MGKLETMRKKILWKLTPETQQKLKALDYKYPNVKRNVYLGALLWVSIFYIIIILMPEPWWFIIFSIAGCMSFWLGHYRGKHESFFLEVHTIIKEENPDRRVGKYPTPKDFYMMGLMTIILGIAFTFW